VPYQVTFELRLSESIHRKKQQQQQGQKEKEKIEKRRIFTNKEEKRSPKRDRRWAKKKRRRRTGKPSQTSTKVYIKLCTALLYIKRYYIPSSRSLKREEFTL
jgi:hypothetical protein